MILSLSTVILFVYSDLQYTCVHVQLGAQRQYSTRILSLEEAVSYITQGHCVRNSQSYQEGLPSPVPMYVTSLLTVDLPMSYDATGFTKPAPKFTTCITVAGKHTTLDF